MSRLDVVGFAKQSAFGTKNATPSYYAPVESASLDGTFDLITKEETVLHNFPIPADPGAQIWKADIKQRPLVASLPRIMSGFFGAPTSTLVGTTAYTHSFDPTVTTAPAYHSLLVSRRDPATKIVDLAYDGAMDSWKLSCAMKDNVKLESAWVFGQNDDTQADPSASLDTSEGWDWSEVTVYWNLNGGGEVAMKVNTWEIDYQGNLEQDHFVMGQRNFAALPKATGQNCTAKVTVTEEDAATLLSYYRQAVKTSSRDSFTLRVNAVGSNIETTYYNSFDLKLWNAEILQAPAEVDSGSRLRSIPLTIRANYDSVNSKYVTLDVTNTVTSY